MVALGTFRGGSLLVFVGILVVMSATKVPILRVYDLVFYTTSSFGAAEASALDQGFEPDLEVV
jgi:hypothetical protein